MLLRSNPFHILVAHIWRIHLTLGRKVDKAGIKMWRFVIASWLISMDCTGNNQTVFNK
jgi:hypothetical protein